MQVVLELVVSSFYAMDKLLTEAGYNKTGAVEDTVDALRKLLKDKRKSDDDCNDYKKKLDAVKAVIGE